MRLNLEPGLVPGLFLTLVLLFLTGCSAAPARDVFKLPESSLAERQLQSRRFDTLDRVELLNASVGVLQDLGFTLEVTSFELGVLTGSKELDARHAGQIAIAAGQVTLSVLLAIVTQDISQLPGSVPAVDDEQKVRVCLVVNQSLENKDASVVRATMSRVIWNTKGQVTRAEILTLPELYEAFFDKLSKATFLQAHAI